MTEMSSANRAFAAVAGACVADAAALGLHWIYDPEHLRRIAGDRPEFRPPRREDYQGVAAYFAHEARSAGELSQYGEALVLALQACAEPGPFQARSFQDRFRSHFGPGGAFRGYIDHPTQAFLKAYADGEAQAKAAVDAPATVINKALGLIRRRHGPALAAVLEGEDAATQAAARAMDAAWPDRSGSDDDQLPSLCSIPPLAARFAKGPELASAVASATAITHENPVASAANQAAANALAAMIAGADAPFSVFDQGLPSPLGEALTKARASSSTTIADDLEAAAGDFGRACHLHQGLPLALWILERSRSFVEACRANILAGGDSCGRAMFLGAAAGARFGFAGPKGIPASWFARLDRGAEIAALLEDLLWTQNR